MTAGIAPKLVDEHLSPLWAQCNLVEEYEDVNRDKAHGHKRRDCGGIVIAQWDHGSNSICFSFHGFYSQR